jgi:LPS export ABC transporter protein LptC
MRLILLFGFLFYSCSNNPNSVKEFIETGNLPVERIEGAKMLHTENGVLKVKVIATTVKRFLDIQPGLVFSNGIEVIFYNDSGLVESVLRADNAEVDEVKNIMTASKTVSLTSAEGEELQTEELIWDEKQNKIYTDKKVTIRTSKEVIEGQGFESNTNFSEYSISKIKGTFDFETPN